MWEAVTVDAFNPKLIPLEFENVTAERLFDVVPADRFMAVSDVATDAVSVEAFRPKETPLLLEKVMAERRFEVVPPDTRIFERPASALAVMVDPLRPKETLLELLNTTTPKLSLVVPAEKLTGEGAAVPPEITTLPLVIPTETLPNPWKITEDALVVPVDDWVVLPVANMVIC